MDSSLHNVRACPKFERHTRIYRKGEPMCFYLLEYVKQNAKARFKGSMATFIYKAIERHFENLFYSYAPLRKALQRAKHTNSRMAKSAY